MVARIIERMVFSCCVRTLARTMPAGKAVGLQPLRVRLTDPIPVELVLAPTPAMLRNASSLREPRRPFE
jgi:hypothetical protein